MCVCVCVFFFFFFLILCRQKFIRPAKFQSLYAGAGVLHVSILHHLRLTPSCHLRFCAAGNRVGQQGHLNRVDVALRMHLRPHLFPKAVRQAQRLGARNPAHPLPCRTSCATPAHRRASMYWGSRNTWIPGHITRPFKVRSWAQASSKKTPLARHLLGPLGGLLQGSACPPLTRATRWLEINPGKLYPNGRAHTQRFVNHHVGFY